MIKSELHHCITAQDLICSIYVPILPLLEPAAMLTRCFGILFWKSDLLWIWLCNVSLSWKANKYLERNEIIQWKALCSNKSNETSNFGPCWYCGMIFEMEKEETEVNKVNLHLNRIKSNNKKEADTCSHSHMHGCWQSWPSYNSHLQIL